MEILYFFLSITQSTDPLLGFQTTRADDMSTGQKNRGILHFNNICA